VVQWDINVCNAIVNVNIEATAQEDVGLDGKGKKLLEEPVPSSRRATVNVYFLRTARFSRLAFRKEDDHKTRRQKTRPDQAADGLRADRALFEGYPGIAGADESGCKTQM